MSQRILLTGGNGFLGRHLAAELRQRGHVVTITDKDHVDLRDVVRCDVREFRQLTAVIEHARPDIVYHLAAEFGRRNGEEFYEELWATNAIGTKHLLRLQERYRFRLIFTSSSEIYGDYGGVMAEDVPDRVPLRQLNEYAISKWVNELQILNSASRAGTQSVRVRLFNIYGPGEEYTPYRSALCVFLYHALHGLPLTVYRTHRRTSCYVADAIRTLTNIPDRFHDGEVYNIAGLAPHDMESVARRILLLTGASPSLLHIEPQEAHNTVHKQPDTRKAVRDLGHQETTSLEEGLHQTMIWQRDYYHVPVPSTAPVAANALKIP